MLTGRENEKSAIWQHHVNVFCNEFLKSTITEIFREISKRNIARLGKEQGNEEAEGEDEFKKFEKILKILMARIEEIFRYTDIEFLYAWPAFDSRLLFSNNLEKNYLEKLMGETTTTFLRLLNRFLYKRLLIIEVILNEEKINEIEEKIEEELSKHSGTGGSSGIPKECKREIKIFEIKSPIVYPDLDKILKRVYVCYRTKKQDKCKTLEDFANLKFERKQNKRRIALFFSPRMEKEDIKQLKSEILSELRELRKKLGNLINIEILFQTKLKLTDNDL